MTEAGLPICPWHPLRNYLRPEKLVGSRFLPSPRRTETFVMVLCKARVMPLDKLIV